MDKTINIAINKTDVLDEVAKTSAYIGSKKVEQKEGAYDRIFITSEDRSMLDRFFNEGCCALTNLLRRFVTIVDTSQSYSVTLNMSSRFDEQLNNSIEESMYSFITNYILGKWCEIADKEGTQNYSDAATALLQDIKEKVFYKTKPTRIAPV